MDQGVCTVRMASTASKTTREQSVLNQKSTPAFNSINLSEPIPNSFQYATIIHCILMVWILYPSPKHVVFVVQKRFELRPGTTLQRLLVLRKKRFEQYVQFFHAAPA